MAAQFITIGGRRHEIRDLESISLVEALRITDVNVRVCVHTCKLALGERVNQKHVIRSLVDYISFFAPSVTVKTIESLKPAELATVDEELKRLLPFAVSIIERFPELQRYHDERAKEEGLVELTRRLELNQGGG